MSNDITIPPEALEAAAKILHAPAEIFDDVAWEDLSDADQDGYMDEARAAIRAALAAWPGMWVEQLWEEPCPTQGIILPLPKEKTDE